jgi:hypothetical protein
MNSYILIISLLTKSTYARFTIQYRTNNINSSKGHDAFLKCSHHSSPILLLPALKQTDPILSPLDMANRHSLNMSILFRVMFYLRKGFKKRGKKIK